MAFHDVRFPTSISYGSSGAPGFSTAVVEGDSGGSERVSRWPKARRHYNAKPGIKTIDALNQTLDFYVARMGPAIGFRYKDWTDFTTAVNHRSAHAMTDIELGTAAGASGTFQLRTKYISGPTTVYRTIEKPVSPTVLLARTPSGGGGAVQITSNFAVDYNTGLITITSGLTAGDTITAGCEFDVPVQFAVELDTNFDIIYENWERGDVPDIPLIEMVGNVTSPERYFYGGSTTVTSTAPFTLDFTKGRVVIYTGSGATTCFAPDPTDLELGGPYFIIYHAGTGALTVKTYDNLNTIGSLSGVGKFAMLLAYSDAGVTKWALAGT